jgi:transcriptional regulator with XRE-family HTH domain
MSGKKRDMEKAQGMAVAKQIRSIRKKKGLSQYELAAKLGVTQRVVSYYERETTNLSVDVVAKIAKALGVPQKKLFELEDEPETEAMTPPGLQKKLNLVAKLPYADQQFVLKTIDMLAIKNELSQQSVK